MLITCIPLIRNSKLVRRSMLCQTCYQFDWLFMEGGACEDMGGTCVDWRNYVCHAGIQSGICPGDSNIRLVSGWI
jgi:hypothetical protein